MHKHNLKQMQIFKQYQDVKYDPALRRFKIRNHYDFAIYKIQQWWRRLQLQSHIDAHAKQ